MNSNFFTHPLKHQVVPNSDDYNKYNKLYNQYGKISNNQTGNDLLRRVSVAPKTLEGIINSKLPYLVSPTLNKKKPIKVIKKKPQMYKAGSGDFKKTNENRVAINSKSKTQIKKKKQIYTEDSVLIGNKVNTNIIHVKEPSLIQSNANSKSKLVAKLSTDKSNNQIINDNLIEVLISNNEKRDNAEIRNSSLFSINEKSYLKANNFDAVEIDIILLKKLIKVDKALGKRLLEKIMNIETFDELQQEKNKGLTMQQIIKSDKNSKGIVNGILSYQLYDILLTRIIPNMERPAQILFSVLSKLNEKRTNKKKKVEKIKENKTNVQKENDAVTDFVLQTASTL